jgi:glycosyltransferase involved in cell wall biosynthesis
MSGRRLAFFLSGLLAGGAERVMLHLCGELSRRRYNVDLVLVRKAGPLLADVPAGVRIIELGTRSRWLTLPTLMRLPGETRRLLRRAIVREPLPKVVRSLSRLVHYLEAEQPAALLATLPNNVLVALWAKWLARTDTTIVVREANTPSLNMSETNHLFEQLFPDLAKRWYPEAQAIIAVSNGVADDLAALTGYPRARIATIYNPVDLHRIAAGMHQPPAAAVGCEAWFTPGTTPVILAVGRLSTQKDYPTLLRAFARIRRQRPARLVILGEGPERPALAALAADLAIADDFAMPGLTANPYAFMARASVLALSSQWEGFPNVLLEALACGCPVVSTDCRSGPRELLADGAFGPLVSVGDDVALAEAIVATLHQPPERSRLQARAGEFALGPVTDAYLRHLLPRQEVSRQTSAGTAVNGTMNPL